MSTEDIKSVAEVLNNILQPDNNIRKEAEKKFEMMQSNIPGKLIKINDHEVVNANYEQMSKEYRDNLKNNMLKALVNEKDKSVKMKICDVIVMVAQNTYECKEKEKWDELLNYISNTLITPLNETNIIEAESALNLIKGIFSHTHLEILKGISVLIPVFRNFFKTNLLSLKTRTVETICEIMCIVDKSHTKMLKEFVNSILETTFQCLQNGKEEVNLKKCLASLIDVCNCEPGVFQKSFSDLFSLCLKISQSESCDENIREMAFEVIVCFVERKKKFFEKDTDKLKLFIQELYKYGLEMDDEITEEWAIPKGDSYFDEEIISEEKVACALAFVERLSEVFSSKFFLPYISEIVLNLLKNTKDFRYKYLALSSISNMISFVDDIKDVESIIPIIFEHSTHENAKIRFASITCISQLTENFEQFYQKDYHEKTFEIIVTRVIEDPILRNRLEACSTLTTFLENMDNDILINYVGVILEKMFSIFLTDIPTNLRETILDVITELVETLKDKFDTFAEKSLTILIEFLAKIWSMKVHKSLYGNLVNCITMIGPYCKTHYFKYLNDIVKITVELQDTIVGDSVSQTYIKNALERITPFLITDFPDSLGSVVHSVIKLIKNVPNVLLKETPKESFSLVDLLKNEDGTEKPEKKKTTLHTSDTEDVDSSLTLLNTLVEKMGKVFLPYVTITEEVILPLLTFYINDEVRVESCNILPTMLIVIKDNCSVEDLHLKAKNYITQILAASDTEFDNGTLGIYLENMGILVETAGVFLNTQELNNFFSKIMILFDKTEKRRIQLLAEQKKVLEAPVMKEEALNSDDEESDDGNMKKDFEQDIEEIEEIQEYTADLIGILFKTHKELTLEIVKKINADILPNYFRNNASIFEIKMGIFIVDDLIEFLGQELLKEVWDDLAKVVIGFCTHHSIEIRRAASYGVGVLAKFTKSNFSKYSGECVNALVNALNFTMKDSDDEDQFEGAKDNATASLGKIIKHQTDGIDISSIIPKWLEHLPILNDLDESEEQHLMLCQIVNNQSNLVIGQNFVNLPKVLKIFARVYNTKKYSNEEIDKNIKNIITSILSNNETKNILIHTKEHLTEKEGNLKKKFDTFLSGSH